MGFVEGLERGRRWSMRDALSWTRKVEGERGEEEQPVEEAK